MTMKVMPVVHARTFNLDFKTGKLLVAPDAFTEDDSLLIYNIAKERNIELEDFTCPNVVKIHEIAKEYSDDNYYIFLFGNKEHPENIGTISFCGNYYSVID